MKLYFFLLQTSNKFFNQSLNQSHCRLFVSFKAHNFHKTPPPIYMSTKRRGCNALWACRSLVLLPCVQCAVRLYTEALGRNALQRNTQEAERAANDTTNCDRPLVNRRGDVSLCCYASAMLLAYVAACYATFCGLAPSHRLCLAGQARGTGHRKPVETTREPY